MSTNITISQMSNRDQNRTEHAASDLIKQSYGDEEPDKPTVLKIIKK